MQTQPHTIERKRMDPAASSERSFFFTRLTHDRAFMRDHFVFLARTAFESYLNRFNGKFERGHKRRKKRPECLSSAMHLEIPEIGSPDVLKNIPRRRPPGMSSRPMNPDTDIYENSPGSKDREDIFYLNRWGWLLGIDAIGKYPASKVREHVERWSSDNKDGESPSWEPYSSSERVANILTWLSCMTAEDAACFSDSRLGYFLTHSLRWIFDHLEYYGFSRTNNHIINNARALIMGGVSTGSKDAYGAGMALLRSMLPELVQPEGMLRERSSHYQLIMLNWVLDSLFFSRGSSLASRSDLDFLEDFATRMAKGAALLCDKNGHLLARIGDISPDATPRQSALRLDALYPEYWPQRDGDPRPSGRADDWYRLDEGRGAILANFPSGDFPQPFRTHGHKDHTSFVWVFDGKEILSDGGRYRYTEDGISLRQQGARLHNLPTVEGLAPICEGITGGEWVPLPYARARLTTRQVDRNRVQFSHNGFRRGGIVEQHKREIELNDDSACVFDRFDGTGRADIVLNWNFGPTFKHAGSGDMAVEDGGHMIHIKIMDAPAPSTVEWAYGGEEGGWYSSAYGKAQPAATLRLGWTATLPFSVKVLFEVSPCAA